MNSTVSHQIFMFLLALPVILISSCDKIPIPDMVEVEEEAAPAASSVTPSETAPTQPVSVPKPKSPAELIKEFKSLKPSDIEDKHLESIANLEEAQSTFEAFDLSQSKVSDEGIEKLKNFKKITSLNLSKTYVRGTGLQALELDNLQELYLDKTQFNSAVGEKLKEFPSLKILGLRETGLSDSFYEVFAELPNLEVLHLDGNKTLLGRNFSEMINSGHFENLRVLTASNSQFGYYGLLAIDKLKHLEILEMGSTGLNLKAMIPISKCKNLKELNLSSNPLSDESLVPLRRLKSLEVLNLSRCRGLSNSSVKTLRTMKQLKKLVLTETSITPSSIDALKKALKETEVVAE